MSVINRSRKKLIRHSGFYLLRGITFNYKSISAILVSLQSNRVRLFAFNVDFLIESDSSYADLCRQNLTHLHILYPYLISLRTYIF